jgi:hypothetical protein
MEISVEFLKKLKTELPYDPATSLLGMHLKECKGMHTRDTCMPMLIAELSLSLSPSLCSTGV